MGKDGRMLETFVGLMIIIWCAFIIIPMTAYSISFWINLFKQLV